MTDTGIGVPEADRERIFESFQQGGRGSSREEGTGLGLTLSRRIVELLGGRMWLRERGRRRQHVRLLATRATPEEPASRPDGADRRRAATVVVIEDDRPSLDLLSAYLSGASPAASRPRGTGSRVWTRSDASGRTPCCSTSGCPASTGGRCCRRSRRTPETRTSRSIVVSIVDERAARRRDGSRGYLVKPISRGTLLAALAGRRRLGWPTPRQLTKSRRRHDAPSRILVVEDNPQEPQARARRAGRTPATR